MSKVTKSGATKPKCKKACCNSPAKSFIFLLNNPDNNSVVVELRHPQSRKPALFLFSEDNTNIFEVFTFSDPYRAYFIDETVHSNGKLYLTTPIDPLYMLLPYLSASSYCSPIDQILKDEEFPEIHRLSQCVGLKNLSLISDRKGSEELNAYKFNEEKTLKWLEKKVEATVQVLKDQGIHTNSNQTVSANFVQASNEKDSLENLKVYAFGLVSDYISEELKIKLHKHLNLPSEVEVNKRKKDNGEESKSKKIKSEDIENSPPKPYNEPKNKTPPASKTSSVSAKEKARAKAALGTKSISSFFTKK